MIDRLTRELSYNGWYWYLLSYRTLKKPILYFRELPDCNGYVLRHLQEQGRQRFHKSEELQIPL